MPRPRLAVLHTVALLAERFKTRIADRFPDLDSFHMLDESLLQDLMRDGPSAGIVARVVGHAQLAERAGATGLLFTCSSTSPAVDVARRVVSIPIVKIDDAMAAKAVTLGNRIGVICTTTSTQGPSRDLLLDHAKGARRKIEVETRLCDSAYHALIGGDRDTHDRIVTQAARDLAPHVDTVVLAQASIAHLRETLDGELAVPVLASPDLCIQTLDSQLDLTGANHNPG
ncbi:aspartate/glutamate racemase family protein [Oceaniglobus trochenteri]|uniref:aspartate/glutamate racemase family protein n=1 Tax=Oceaniglobus trochenteri TaxID=2763260 RepID=UPI001CFFEFB9|nr:aspartate/glutamate racemase family protein [Oceaniglobus trochenteri]